MSNGNIPAPAPEPWYKRINPHWIGYVVTPIVTAIVTALVTWIAHLGGNPVPVIPPPPDEPVIVQKGGNGWISPTPEETASAIVAIEAQQQMPAQFSRIAQDTMEGPDEGPDDGHAVFMFDAEQKVLGKVLDSWDQGPFGECVSFGWGRLAQDILLEQIATNRQEQWPGREVATEPIYGGSRVQIGGARIRGDGSVGAWAGQWVQKYGVNFRQVYGTYDLSAYSGSLGRKWGTRPGVPSVVQDAAKQHPIKTVAQVKTAGEIWAALGSNYPIAVCSDYGFEGRIPADGIFERGGTWGHCMEIRGRFTHPQKGQCVVVQNSWGDYLGRRITVDTVDRGKVTLPQGCFAIRLATAAKMAAEGDTFTASGLVGFPKRRIDWPTQVQPKRRPDRFLDPLFALAP